MSDEIKELVHWLRAHGQSLQDAMGLKNVPYRLTSAADALEAMAGEVERAKAKATSMQRWIDHHNERADKAEAERDRLAGEVERLTVAAKAADMFHAINGHGIKQAEELADHIIRQMLWGMRIDDSNKGIVRGYLLDHFKAVISRAEAAESERDRLKAALQQIASQKTFAELEAGAEDDDYDLIGAWDIVIGVARTQSTGR